MLAESVHSVADSGNQVLLFVGTRPAAQARDERAPVRLRPRALLLRVRGRGRAVHRRRAVLRSTTASTRSSTRTRSRPGWSRSSCCSSRSCWSRSRSAPRSASRTTARRAVVGHVHPTDQGARAARSSCWRTSAALIGLMFAFVRRGARRGHRRRPLGRHRLAAIGLLLARRRGRPGGGDEVAADRRGGRPEDMRDDRAARSRPPEVARVIHMRTLHLGPDERWSPRRSRSKHDDTAAEVARGIDAAEQRVRAAVPIARSRSTWSPTSTGPSTEAPGLRPTAPNGPLPTPDHSLPPYST